jgi:hypothetical protein
MIKYISIETTNSGVLLFPNLDWFIPTLISSDSIGLGEIALACVNANQQLIDNINEAFVSAAQASYTDVVFPVTIPNGVEILGLDFGGGGGDLCEFYITAASPDPIFQFEFQYIDEFGNITSLQVPNDGTTYGPYVGECGSMMLVGPIPSNPSDITIDSIPLSGPVTPP